MRVNCSTTVLICGLFAATLCRDVQVAAADPTTPISAKANPGVTVESIRRIWCGGEHNAFPDLEFFKDRWFVAVREGTAHGIAGFGRVRIISSKDGTTWESVAVFDGFGDYRRGELSVTPDGRLMLVSKFNHYDKAKPETRRAFQARDHAGKKHTVVSRRYENRVAFSTDGKRFGELQPVDGTHPRAWFYSGVQWYKKTGYAIDRQGRKLYRTRDGRKFEALSDVPVGNESRIAFRKGGTMVVFFRNGSLATSKPPYETWTVNATNNKGPHSYGGPGIIVLPSGDVWTASRHRIDPKQFDWPAGENKFPDGTVLFRLDGKKLQPKLLIRGGGDRGYNGLVFRDSFLWMAYNAPSREAKRSCIYLAKIRVK